MRYVDYTSVSSLTSALQGVETVISVLKIPGPEWITYQLNLLTAAKEAGVKRFAPAEYEIGPVALGKVDILALKPPVWEACEKSELECARFCCGMFMNYLGLGHKFEGKMRKKEKELLHGFQDEPMIWDVGKRKAELPVKDDGTFPAVTLTEIGDIGRFVAAACELPLGKWEKTMSMVGDTINVDEVVGLLVKYVGASFEVSKVGRQELQSRADSVQGIGSSREELLKKMTAQIEMVILEEEVQACVLDPVINRLCPSVKPYNVDSYLEQLYS